MPTVTFLELSIRFVADAGTAKAIPPNARPAFGYCTHDECDAADCGIYALNVDVPFDAPVTTERPDEFWTEVEKNIDAHANRAFPHTTHRVVSYELRDLVAA